MTENENKEFDGMMPEEQAEASVEPAPEQENLEDSVGFEQFEFEEEESTIFADPSQKREPEKIKKRRPLRIILILAIVLVLVGVGAFAAIRFIPKPQEDNTELAFDLVNNETDSVELVEIIGEEGAKTFFSTAQNLESDSSVSQDLLITWGIQGLDSRLTDSDTISSTIDYISKVQAIRKMENATDEDFGLDDPSIIVKVHARNKAFEDYTISVGNKSYDSTGNYVKISGVDGIYLMDASYAEEYLRKTTDYATRNTVEKLEETDPLGDYFVDGKLTTCDKITLSGANFSPAIVFEPNNIEATKTYATFCVTSPVKRYARDVSNLLNIAGNGLVGDGAYLYHPTDAQITAYGLDNPIARLTIEIGEVTYDLRIAPAPVEEDAEQYYCLVDQNREAIFRVAKSSLAFVTASPSDYYNTFLTMEMLMYLKSFEVSAEGKNYIFKVDYDESAPEGEDFDISINGKAIKQSYFQNFYSYFLSLEAVEYTASDMTGKIPECTVTMRHHDKSVKDTVMQLYKVSDQRYQVNVGGDGLGLITATSYKKLLRYADAVAQNTDLQ